MKKQRRISAFVLAIFLATVALGELYPLLITTAGDTTISFQKSCKRKGVVDDNTSTEALFVQNSSETSADKTTSSVSCAPIFHQLQSPSGAVLYSARINFVERPIIGERPHLKLLDKPPR